MPDPARITELTKNLIKRFEGCRLTAYPDPGTGGDPWTIGYGATGAGIVDGTVWTQEQAEADLAHRVTELVNQVARLLTRELPEPSCAALVSFAYNVGIHALGDSTLLRLVNAGEYANAAAQFQKWVHAAGHVLPGLVKRRDAEREVFLSGFDAPSSQSAA